MAHCEVADLSMDALSNRSVFCSSRRSAAGKYHEEPIGSYLRKCNTELLLVQMC